MIALIAFLGLVAFASAQYSCAPGFCSQNNGLDRADVLGCMYFCYLDISLNELLERSEFHTRFGEWTAGGDTCDEACFVTAHQAIIPACDTELVAAYNRMAVLDGDGTNISHADIDAWVNVLAGIQGGEPIDSISFQSWFRALYNDIADPTCTLPYP